MEISPSSLYRTMGKCFLHQADFCSPIKCMRSMSMTKPMGRNSLFDTSPTSRFLHYSPSLRRMEMSPFSASKQWGFITSIFSGKNKMCGILGSNFLDERSLRTLNDLQNHRGPDQDGIFIDGDVVSIKSSLEISSELLGDA